MGIINERYRATKSTSGQRISATALTSTWIFYYLLLSIFPWDIYDHPDFFSFSTFFLFIRLFNFVRHDTRPTSHGKRAALEHVPPVYLELNAFSSISIALSSISFFLYTADLFPGHEKSDRQSGETLSRPHSDMLIDVGEGACPFFLYFVIYLVHTPRRWSCCVMIDWRSPDHRKMRGLLTFASLYSTLAWCVMIWML